MADLVYVAVIAGFFAVCVSYVNWCDRMIGTGSGVDSNAEPPRVLDLGDESELAA